MAQCTGQIEFFAAMMNYMPVPEYIYVVAPAMDPITLEIQHEKSDHVCPDRGFDFEDCEMFYHPTVTDNTDANPEHILGYIGNAGAEAGDHIHIPDRIPALVPAIPFFK